MNQIDPPDGIHGDDGGMDDGGVGPRLGEQVGQRAFASTGGDVGP